MLKFNITPLFKARQIEKPYSFLIKAGFTHSAATTIVNNKRSAFTLKQITLLCKILYCEPNDLLVYKPLKNDLLPPNHPLLNLKEKEFNLELQETFKTMSLAELNEIGQFIANQKKNQNPETDSL